MSEFTIEGLKTLVKNALRDRNKSDFVTYINMLPEDMEAFAGEMGRKADEIKLFTTEEEAGLLFAKLEAERKKIDKAIKKKDIVELAHLDIEEAYEEEKARREEYDYLKEIDIYKRELEETVDKRNFFHNLSEYVAIKIDEAGLRDRVETTIISIKEEEERIKKEKLKAEEEAEALRAEREYRRRVFPTRKERLEDIRRERLEPEIAPRVRICLRCHEVIPPDEPVYISGRGSYHLECAKLAFPEKKWMK